MNVNDFMNVVSPDFQLTIDFKIARCRNHVGEFTDFFPVEIDLDKIDSLILSRKHTIAYTAKERISIRYNEDIPQFLNRCRHIHNLVKGTFDGIR